MNIEPVAYPTIVAVARKGADSIPVRLTRRRDGAIEANHSGLFGARRPYFRHGVWHLDATRILPARSAPTLAQLCEAP